MKPTKTTHKKPIQLTVDALVRVRGGATLTKPGLISEIGFPAACDGASKEAD
jgi:hypothetical protein